MAHIGPHDPVRVLLVGLALAGLTGASAQAQSAALNLPDLSQAASISQRIGLTDISVSYHRPLTRGRKIFGGIVPEGQVWRAGADMNTVIRFSDPVQINGAALAAGSYGLFMIPGEQAWTVIFSRNSTSWGAFSYDRTEDALRVQVTPLGSSVTTALGYEFDDPTPNSVTLAMRWDQVEIPLRITVDTAAVVQHSLPLQLRGRAGLSWQPWEEAANYLLNHGLDAKQAEYDAEQGVATDDCFETEITRARALLALGKTAEAATARSQAFALTHSQFEVYIFARTLQGFGELAFPLELFRMDSATHPGTWMTHEEKMRLAVAAGDYSGAEAEAKLGVSMGPAGLKPTLELFASQVAARIDIN